jgi:hypothetical protein
MARPCTYGTSKVEEWRSIDLANLRRWKMLDPTRVRRTFTDPTGYCFLGCFWQPIFRAIQNLFRSVPILGAIVQIAAVALCPVAPVVCAGLASTFVTGVTSGKLGLALKSGFISAITALAFFEVGELVGLDYAAAGTGDGYLRLTDQAVEIVLLRSKARTEPVTVLVPRAENPRLLAAFERWGITDGEPLFRSIKKGGHIRRKVQRPQRPRRHVHGGI